MTTVLFYEKPGCINNTRQKAMLEALGHEVDARNLLTEDWSPQRLRAFFGDRPPTEWFNASAPRIKSGEVVPARLSESEALVLMLDDRLLIRRPLIQTESGRSAGFEPCPVLTDLGVVFKPQDDLQSCPRTHAQSACEPPEPDDAAHP